MSSNLRVNSIVPATGTNVAIGTAGGTISYNANVSGVSTFSSNIIVATGSIGVGTANPTSQLHVFRNTTDGSPAALTLQNNGNTGSYATLFNTAGSVSSQLFADAGGNVIGTPGVMFRTTTNHPLVFGTNNTETMRIDGSGRITMPYQPFAFVTRSANVSMSPGTKIPFDSVVDSRGLTWSTSNNNFVVPATGVYTFSIYIRLETTALNWIYALIRSNGSIVYGANSLYLQKPNTLDTFQTIGVTISVKLTQNDTVDVTGHWNGGGSYTLFGSQSLMSIVFNG